MVAGFSLRRVVDQIPLLKGIGVIVKKQPGTFQRAAVGIARAAEAAVFDAATAPMPFAKGVEASEKGAFIIIQEAIQIGRKVSAVYAFGDWQVTDA